jgi:hypothetical protein
MKNICVGLFGTCDNIPWRYDFIETLIELDIEFFNPDAGDNWHPGMVDDENHHLMEDDIILFPILKDSLSLGSLGEIGFSVLNVMRNIANGSNQYLIIMIDDECTDDRKTDDERTASVKARKLVKSKVVKVNHPNVFVVGSLVEMKALVISLAKVVGEYEALRERYSA